MSVDLNELERLAAQATPGPWETLVTLDWDKYVHTVRGGDGAFLFDLHKARNGEANAVYIVAACNAVPELIARVRELELTVEYMHREYIEDASDCDHVGLACPHRVGKWWCGADEEEHIKCHTRAAIKYAKEAGE